MCQLCFLLVHGFKCMPYFAVLHFSLESGMAGKQYRIQMLVETLPSMNPLPEKANSWLGFIKDRAAKRWVNESLHEVGNHNGKWIFAMLRWHFTSETLISACLLWWWLIRECAEGEIQAEYFCKLSSITNSPIWWFKAQHNL